MMQGIGIGSMGTPGAGTVEVFGLGRRLVGEVLGKCLGGVERGHASGVGL